MCQYDGGDCCEGGDFNWIGDGFCDDINNNGGCKYDGGDCCGANVKKHYCLECECIGMFYKYLK